LRFLVQHQLYPNRGSGELLVRLGLKVEKPLVIREKLKTILFGAASVRG
jgi:hypothetical protein